MLTSRIPCADPRESRSEGFSDPEPFTGYEPNRIVEQEDITCTEDKITEIQGHVKIVSYNQSLLTSTQDSTESIATPQEADLDDEQIRALLALPRYLLEREASAERSQVYHSEREGLMSSSSQGPELHRHRRTCGMALTSEKVESRRVCRERESESNLLMF